MRNTGRYLIIYLLIVVGMAVLFYASRPPSCRKKIRGIPDYDSAPSGATQERTQKVLDQVTHYYLNNEKRTSKACLP
ncbi:hypothetical protein MYA98_18180 [Salmonella sp. WGH-01]|nr:hypothetical protein MYA98_18180 [Salmonella sp. WGH-01]